MEQKLIIDTIRTVTVILGALVAGYGLRKSGRAGPDWGPRVNRLALVWVQPLVIAVALWAMKRPDWQTLALPLFAFAHMVVMWPLGALAARLLPMSRPDRGAFVGSAIFNNQGFTYGTFLAFVALGSQGAALGSVYCIAFMPAFFTFGFYVGRRYSSQGNQGLWEAVRGMFSDAETRNPTLGILAGLALSALQAPIPPAAPLFIDVAIPATTAAFLLAIGLGLRLSAIRDYWRECLLMHAVKLILSPVAGLLLAVPFGYWALADHSLLKVCFIMCASPVAIMSVMLAQVFELNERLAGALWLTTNLSWTLGAPLILWATHAL